LIGVGVGVGVGGGVGRGVGVGVGGGFGGGVGRGVGRGVGVGVGGGFGGGVGVGGGVHSMKKKILALDLATETGWAHSKGPSGVWRFKINRDESSGMRLLRLEARLQEVDDSVGVDIVVFEAARNAAPGMQGALVVQAELQSVTKRWCEVNGIEYRGYSPSEIKKHACGKGKCSKEVMVETAEKKWPDKSIEDHNEADALWLLDLAMKDLGIGE
jgi:Holliday junction resolvasome RuvABC endonuclease subunit